MSIEILPLESNELPMLVDLSRTTFYDTFYQQNSPEDMELFLANSFSVEVLLDEISDPSNYFFIARTHDRIAGYLKLSTAKFAELRGEVLEICRIYVVKEKLGTGVGLALMNFAFSFAKVKRKKILFLGVWENNKTAISFYESFGFEKFGQHIFMVGKDAQVDWLMKREL